MPIKDKTPETGGMTALEKDVKGQLLVTLKTCCDCSLGLTCQTRGGPPMIGECQRPLGLVSRPLVSVKAKYDFLWQSPLVPLRVKVDTLVAIASKACDLYDNGVGVPDKDRGYNLRKVFGAMSDAQREYWETGWVGNGHRNVDHGLKNWYLKNVQRHMLRTDIFHSSSSSNQRTGLPGCVSHAYRALCYTLTSVKKKIGAKRRKARWDDYWSFVEDCRWAGVRLVQALTGTAQSSFDVPAHDPTTMLPYKYTEELQKQVDHLITGYRKFGETREEKGD